MPKQPTDDLYREKFRPNSDLALDREVEAALSGISEADLYSDKPQVAPGENPPSGDRQTRRGRIVQIDKDDIFVDFGGKSQGIVSRLQFLDGTEPKVGDEMDFNVDKYDTSEGLLLLSRKGATATNVSWENLEVGQIIEATVTGSNKGGLELEIKAMRAFMPAGAIAIGAIAAYWLLSRLTSTNLG